MGRKEHPSSGKEFNPVISFADKKIGLVISKWNSKVTENLSKGALEILSEYGVPAENIFQHYVPGSFELPYAAKILLSKRKLDAVICLGCVIKGETRHDEYISNAVANGLMSLSIHSGKPVIFGVLTANNMDQALARAGGDKGNKGTEAAITALEMIQFAEQIDKKDKPIGFS